jgi:hypothetical protein
MKKTGIVLAVILFLYLGLSILGSVLIMHIPRLPVNVSPSSVSLTYEEVSFSGRGDSLTLKGWFLPGQGNDVIILVHGGYQTRIDDTADTLGLAQYLVQKGYSILLFDQHGRGESDGTARALKFPAGYWGRNRFCPRERLRAGKYWDYRVLFGRDINEHLCKRTERCRRDSTGRLPDHDPQYG